MTLNDTWRNKNHSADCYRVIPVPNPTTFESRVICICGLQGFDNRGDYRAQDNQDKTTEKNNTP